MGGGGGGVAVAVLFVRRSTNRKICVTSAINSSKLACEVDAKS